MFEKKLKGKKIAIVSMGRSQLDYHMSISHSQEYDEVWAINSMCAVIKCDRVFMMDPASRFFDTFDAGPQTQVMCRTLPKLEIPIYSCEKDNRVPAIELYPLKEVVKELGCGYLNNTIAYAIAFAALNKVGSINMYGADFSYSTNIHFGEMGRACCEFWLAKCMDLGIDVSVAASSSMLDTNVPEEQKLYGYHRLDNPPVIYMNKGELDVANSSEIEKEEVIKGFSGRTEQITLGPPEPEAY
tara:strand:- start:526 stop:1251 length:726 start_codon:yes stop_codon:yes gene_type:complete